MDFFFVETAAELSLRCFVVVASALSATAIYHGFFCQDIINTGFYGNDFCDIFRGIKSSDLDSSLHDNTFN